MNAASLAGMVGRSVLRSRRHFLFSAIGLVVGTATLTFFLALSLGIRERVLNRLYPVNQVEFQVERVALFGLGLEVPARIDKASLAALSGLPGVEAVFPKQRTKFQARLWGGADVFGQEARLEAFFDGLEPATVRDELAASETAVLGPEDLGLACKTDADCRGAASCRSGACRRRTYWDTFRDTGEPAGCRADANCPPGLSCVSGTCATACAGPADCPAAQVCASRRCLRSCTEDAACDPGEACVAFGALRACDRLLCRLPDPKDAFSEDRRVARGVVVAPAGLPRAPCPEGTYCATSSVTAAEGACIAPIPVLIAPFVLDVYNNVAASALGLRRLSGLEVLLGVEFTMLYGESYFAPDEQVERRVLRRARIAGFSAKAMDFGVTAPLPYVVRANTMLRGRAEASEYTSVVVVTTANEDVPALVEDARVLGLTLAPRSEEGRKAANVLLILTLVFAMVSLIILGISAINITHTFLMLVTERRHEIAVFRAVGAGLWDIRGLVLGEAALLGIVGGALGIGAGFLASRLVNVLAAPVLGRIPGSPSDLFAFSALALAMGLGCAVIFAVAGAFVPARAAARTDPATVLSQG